MPLAGFETFVPTISDFETHWGATNITRASDLVLKDGLNLAGLGVLKAQVGSAVTDANLKTDAAVTAGNAYKAARTLVYNRMGDFRRAAAYYLSDKDYAGKILPLPKETRDDGDLFKVADSIFYAWDAANADLEMPITAHPLVLTDGTTLEAFQAEVEALRGLQSGISGADNAAATARNVRDGLCFQARRDLKEYRKAILALYAPTSNEVKTLPKLVVNPKPSPDAPKLKVEYVAGESSAKLSWIIEPDVSLSRFFVNMSPGVRYSAKNAVRLADLDDFVREFVTAQNTIAAGATVWFKVIAVDDDAHEASSNSVKVVRAA